MPKLVAAQLTRKSGVRVRVRAEAEAEAGLRLDTLGLGLGLGSAISGVTIMDRDMGR